MSFPRYIDGFSAFMGLILIVFHDTRRALEAKWIDLTIDSHLLRDSSVCAVKSVSRSSKLDLRW